MCFHLNDAAFCLQPVIKNIGISPNIHFCNSYNLYVYIYIHIYIDVGETRPDFSKVGNRVCTTMPLLPRVPIYIDVEIDI